ncbi:hypothetical protein ABT043_22050 [Streptomyces sp. NPDC002418]|uniref:tetratricopeptide repeat protein n=2 Tax=Streptomyces TaxID=1883 RepID=UPI003317FA87
MVGRWWNRPSQQEALTVGGAPLATGVRSVAAGGDIGVVVTGDGNNVYQVAAPPRAASSDYGYQVESLAAAEFHGRHDELAAMAAFSIAPGDVDEGVNAYCRWLAPAWAGKTALMAAFVLAPPPEVDIVSFFITSRLNRQNDRTAFCEVVHRQFYALLGEEEPAVTEHTREESLLAAMERTAAVCKMRGRRLVLVVDGLDEDRGVLAGPDSHSIAALLPRSPSHGMRVIVAGRPHPPVPDDVPASHPLRESTIDQWLAPSPFAAAVRREAEDSLLRMLNTGGLARALLGLVTAAGGGLTAADLATLAGTRSRLVELELSTVTGRAFRVRSPHWSSREAGRSAAGVYVLAHEEIQRSAFDLLTDAELAGHRERLYEWADAFHERHWPPHTPEYLLRGYSQFLRTQKDTARLIRLAGDAHRHSRLWQRSGSDLDALSELSAAFDGLVASGGSDAADVSDAFLLAVRRDALRSRSECIPNALISVWASLGQVRRAISLARARQDELARVQAFTGVVRALAADGDLPQAAEVAEEAARLAGTVARPRSEEAVGCAATMLALANSPERAVDMARTLEPPEVRGRVLAQAALAALQSGQRRAGEAIAHAAASSIPDIMPVSAVQTMILAGAYPDALTAARTVGDTDLRAHLLVNIAIAMAKNGQSSDAVAVAEEALSEATDNALAASTAALAQAGEHQRAAELCRSLADPYAQMTSLALVAVALAESATDRSTVVELARESADLADQVTADNLRAHGLTMAAHALALASRHEDAIELLQSLKSNNEREKAVADVVAALAQAADGLGPAARLAHTLSLPRSRSRALAHLADAHMRAGSRQQAEELAREASAATRQGTALGDTHHVGTLSVILAESGAPDLAIAVAQEISDPDRQATTLLKASCGAAKCGRPQDGDAIARTILDPYRRAQALGWVAATAARAGSLELASQLLQRLRKLESSRSSQPVVSIDHSKAALVAMAKALAHSGKDDAAIALATTAQHTWIRADILAAVAKGLIARGEDEKALILVKDFALSPRASRALAPVAATWGRAGSGSKALEAIQALPDSAKQAEALALAAQSLTKTGHLSQLSALARRACTLTDTLTAATWPDHVLYEHVRVLIHQGRLKLAAAVSQHIADKPLRARAVTPDDRVAKRSTPPTHDPDEEESDDVLTVEAVFIVELATEEHNHQQAVASAAAALAWTGQHDQARAVALALPDTFTKDEAIASVAEAMAAFGHATKGLDLARSLADPLQRSRVLGNIAHWTAQRGDYSAAIDVAADISHHEQQSWALLSTVELAIERRQHAHAAAAAHALPDPYDQVRALCAISTAARQHGEDAYAGQLTGALNSVISNASAPEGRTRGRLGCLKAASAEGWGDSSRGRAAAIEALSLVPWHDSIHAVLRTAPQALQSAVRMVLADAKAAAATSEGMP